MIAGFIIISLFQNFILLIRHFFFIFTLIESQRNSSRRRVEDLQRRVWLLRQVSNELTTKKVNLMETKAIAESLCNVDYDQNLEV